MRCVEKQITLALLLLISFNGLAQDEKAFRDLLFYNDREILKKSYKQNYHYKVRSNKHSFDMTGDYVSESIFTAKRDGEDWIHIEDSKGNEVFRHQLDPLGPLSRLFKIQMRKIDNKSKVILLHFFEGVTRYINFRGTTRVYFLTIDDNDLSTFSLFKGPTIWDEYRTYKDHYHQRSYQISMMDFDSDGKREVSFFHRRMSRVYIYKGKGEWFTFDDNIKEQKIK